jgi:hypothetical protein
VALCIGTLNFTGRRHGILKLVNDTTISFMLYYTKIATCVIAHQVKWVACHHSMVCPQVADGVDGFQV